DQLEEIGLGIHEQRVITLLEQVPGFAVLAMYATRVLTRESLHEAAHRHVTDLNGQINRMRRPAECVEFRSAAREHRREQLLERGVIARVGEDRLTCVPLLDDEIESAGDV